MRDNIQFLITPDQAEAICNYYNININDIEDFEISELLDTLIDEVTSSF